MTDAPKVDYTINDGAWAEDLQNDLHEYVAVLHDTLDEEDDYPDTLTGQPFCGCHVCTYREILAFVVPRIIEGLSDGHLSADLNGQPLSVTAP